MIYTREYFQPTYKHNINRDISFYNFDDLLKGVYNFKIDFDVFLPSYGVNLQRGLVWTLAQKEQLILSMLRGVELSKFVIVQHRVDYGGIDSILKIIDGKQRITTIFSFINNEFPIVIEGKDVFYRDLHPYCKRDIKNPNGCKWDIHYSYEDLAIKDDTIVQIFEQINFLATPQDVDHLTKIKKAKIL